MTTTRDYGTWNNHGDRYNLSVEASIGDAINGGDADWRERMESSGALDRIADDYRDAINDALPRGVALCGNDFYGPAYSEDCDWDGYPVTDTGGLDIREIVEGVDLGEIIERHDVDLG